MGTETIMLAKTYKAGKVKYPAYVSEKLDGVACDLAIIGHKIKTGGSITTVAIYSRQGEVLKSVAHIARDLLHQHFDEIYAGMHFVGELYIPNRDFKDISGLVRRQEASDESEQIELHIYDFYIEGQEDMEYEDRMQMLADITGNCYEISPVIKIIPTRLVNNDEELEAACKSIIELNHGQRPTGAEGVIIRSARGKGTGYERGKRPSGFIKRKLTETEDLQVVDFEEAIDAKTKEPLGMVGRVVCRYKGKKIGVGPGKLTHAERRAIWSDKKSYIGKTAEVAYMPDDSYEALREPRFLHWRPDKD